MVKISLVGKKRVLIGPPLSLFISGCLPTCTGTQITRTIKSNVVDRVSNSYRISVCKVDVPKITNFWEMRMLNIIVDELFSCFFKNVGVNNSTHVKTRVQNWRWGKKLEGYNSKKKSWLCWKWFFRRFSSWSNFEKRAKIVENGGHQLCKWWLTFKSEGDLFQKDEEILFVTVFHVCPAPAKGLMRNRTEKNE